MSLVHFSTGTNDLTHLRALGDFSIHQCSSGLGAAVPAAMLGEGECAVPVFWVLRLGASPNSRGDRSELAWDKVTGQK